MNYKTAFNLRKTIMIVLNIDNIMIIDNIIVDNIMIIEVIMVDVIIIKIIMDNKTIIIVIKTEYFISL